MPVAPRAAIASAASDGLTAQHFPRAHRLHLRVDFERLLRSGRRLRVGPIEARYALTVGATARLGVVVGRRAAPLATRRNRIKRLLREGFRMHAATLPAMDVIVRATRPPTSEDELRDALAHVWERLGRVGT